MILTPHPLPTTPGYKPPEGCAAAKQWRDPTGTRFLNIAPRYMRPGVYGMECYVSGAFKSLDAATTFAIAALGIFRDNGHYPEVFIIKGPTSTTRLPYEVTSAPSGYPLIAKYQHPTTAKA